MSQTHITHGSRPGYDCLRFTQNGSLGVPTPLHEWQTFSLGGKFCEYTVAPDGRITYVPGLATDVPDCDCVAALLDGRLTVDDLVLSGHDVMGNGHVFRLRVVNNYVVEVREGATVLFKRNWPPANPKYLSQKVRQFNAGIKKVRELLRVRPKR